MHQLYSYTDKLAISKELLLPGVGLQLYTTQCEESSVHCVLQCNALFSVQCSVFSVQCSLFSVKGALSIVAVCSVNCSVFSVPCAL